MQNAVNVVEDVFFRKIRATVFLESVREGVGIGIAENAQGFIGYCVMTSISALASVFFIEKPSGTFLFFIPVQRETLRSAAHNIQIR